MWFAFPPHLEVMEHYVWGSGAAVGPNTTAMLLQLLIILLKFGQLFLSPTCYSSANLVILIRPLDVLLFFPPQTKEPGPRRPVASIFFLPFPIHQHNTKGRLLKWNKHKEMLCSKPEKWHLGVQFSRKVWGHGKVFFTFSYFSKNNSSLRELNKQKTGD